MMSPRSCTLLFCITQLFWVVNVACLAPPAASNNANNAPASREKAIVVGGGPVGLASAIVLANRGYDVSIFEATSTEEIKTYNPALAYLYNINFRGQVFTNMFPSIHEKLLDRSVCSTECDFMLGPADVTKEVEYPKTPSIAGIEDSYWIPRHEMTNLLWDAVEEHNMNRSSTADTTTAKDKNINNIGHIHFEQGVSCVGVNPTRSTNDDANTNGGDSISVVVKDEASGEEKIVEGKLVVGADGIKSKVRQCLEEKSGLFGTWGYKANKFHVRKWISPASGLKLKTLQVPTNIYKLRNSDGEKVATKNNNFIVTKGTKNGPLDSLSLGSLPVKTSDEIRPINCITRPNHVLWTLKTGAEAKSWFQDNFPRLDFEEMISDREWDRFAKAGGVTFPPCQYCRGLQASSGSGACGVVLVGDAAHGFSPDVGQGINAGLMDVVQLDKTLEDAAKSKELLGTALSKYERIQGPETKALIRVARFGSPYQYNQPLRKDRVGKKLWTANVILRLLLNKVTFGIFPTQIVFNVNNKAYASYRQIARGADMGTATLVSMVALAVFKSLLAQEESEDRWRITIACLNDPSCTKHYDPAGTQAYPFGLLLTLIVICKYYDPTTKVPMIFKDTPEARMTLKMADEYARDLNNNGHRPLEALEEMVQDLNKEVESFLAIASKRAPAEKERKFVVMNCEAVILTMSREYENDNASWYMTSDTDRLLKVTYDLVMGLGKALLHSTAKSTIQELDNADNIATHLVEGNFIQFVEDEDFKESEEYKDAVQVWEDLVKLTEGLKLGPIDIDTKG